MENQQQSLQPQQSFNVSPAVVMFAVLAVLLALVGLYVTNRDIETRGVTVLESTVPLRYESGATGLTGRYPDGWRYEEADGLLIFTPLSAASDDPTAITLVHIEQGLTVEAVMSDIVASATSVLDETDGYDDLPDGETVTVRETGDIEVRYIVFSDEQGGLFLAAARSEDVDEYSRELEAMAQTIGFIEPYALTELIEQPGFTIPAPAGFTPIVPQANFVQLEQDDVSPTEQILFQIVLALPQDVVQTPLESYSSELIVQTLINEAPGINVENDLFPVQVGEFAGSRAVLYGEDTTVLIDVTVLDLGLPEYFVMFTRTPREAYPKVSATINAMLENLVITALVPAEEAGTESDASEPIEGTEIPTDDTPTEGTESAEPTGDTESGETTDASAEPPTTENAVDEVNGIRGE